MTTVGRGVGSGVGDGVGTGVGFGVGTGVGNGVYNIIQLNQAPCMSGTVHTGTGVGQGVGNGVGKGVGNGVGSGVGIGVGDAVTTGVGATAGFSPNQTVAYNGGGCFWTPIPFNKSMSDRPASECSFHLKLLGLVPDTEAPNAQCTL